MVMFSGRCRGGPYNTKQLHHGEDRFLVALELDRAIPPVQHASVRHPDIKIGRYDYDHVRKEWWWDDDSVRSETLSGA